MFDTKFLLTLVTLIVGIATICNLNSKKETNIVENFSAGGFQPRTVIPSYVAVNPKNNQPMYQVPGTFQSQIPPRVFGGSYGANILYNLPDTKNLAVPVNPLTFGNMAKENYNHNQQVTENYNHNQQVTENYGGAKCGLGGSFPPSYGSPQVGGGFNGDAPPYLASDYAASNFNEATAALRSESDALNVSDTLPVGTMETVNSLGESNLMYVVNQPIFANKIDRNFAQSDYIRGDLPIVPCKTGWFQVSARPQTMLNSGAMNVMGGLDNETSKSMAALLNTGTGNSTIGGINMTTQELTSVGALTDVNVTAFV